MAGTSLLLPAAAAGIHDTGVRVAEADAVANHSQVSVHLDQQRQPGVVSQPLLCPYSEFRTPLEALRGTRSR